MSEPSVPPPPAPPPPPEPGAAAPEPEPERGALPPVGWGPGQTLVGLAVLLAVTLVEVSVIAAFDPDLETLAGRLVLQALLAISLAGVAFLLATPGQLTPPSALGLREALTPPWKPAVLAYLVYVGCAIVIAAIIQPEQEDVTEELGYGESALGDVGIGFLIVAVAPVTEELFFRGFMFSGMRRRLPFAAAAAISAGVWGLFHYTGPGTWGVVAQLAVFGIVLAWLYERTGSIWPTIAVHALNNAIAFAILTS
jgi:uncharacterized protein